MLQGTSAGAKDQEADNFLEKRFKNMPQFSYEETVQTAIAALQNVLSEDFKATEIEVRRSSMVLYALTQLLRSPYSIRILHHNMKVLQEVMPASWGPAWHETMAVCAAF